MTIRAHFKAVLCLLLLSWFIGAAPAAASDTFPSVFNSTYPGSQSANNASCRLCHTTSNSQFNQYGRDFAVALRSGMTEVQAFRAVESMQSDTDPAGASNITEINASAQPGWTPGANNTSYARSTLAVVATNQTPPTTITGLLDPPPSANQPPVAHAGTSQMVRVGRVVTLDGSQSSDPDSNPLTYAWTLTALPPGSAAALSGATSVNPTFVPDVAGSYTAQLIVNDGTVNSAPATVMISASLPAVPLDLTGDRKSDIFWRHTTLGELWLWPMNGAQSAAEAYVTTLAEAGWDIRGLGDQTGDGQADVLWRNAATGMIYLWTMNGSSVEAETYVATVETVYDIVGTGDYNGDGKSDILWRDATYGQVWLWLMDGPATQSVTYVDTVDVAYGVKGSGDLNGDGKDDLVWRHDVQGDVWVWLMNGAAAESVAYVTTVPEVEYKIVGVGDHTGDGMADILWHHATRGEVWIWPMNGTVLVSEEFVAAVTEIEYRVVGNGDYDGDAKADILWHHAGRGEVWVWLMDGVTKVSENHVGTVSDVGYQVVKSK